MHRHIFLIFLGLGACSEVMPSGESDTDAEPQAAFRYEFSPATYCDLVGTVSLQLRARYVDCVQQPPAPCTLPTPPQEFLSEVVTCPSAEPSVTLDAVVNRKGRFYVDLVRTVDSGDTLEQCGTVDGQIKVLVDEPQLEDRVVMDVDITGTACPEP